MRNKRTSISLSYRELELLEVLLADLNTDIGKKTIYKRYGNLYPRLLAEARRGKDRLEFKFGSVSTEEE